MKNADFRDETWTLPHISRDSKLNLASREVAEPSISLSPIPVSAVKGQDNHYTGEVQLSRGFT
jgi:hypothetical protein